MAKERMLQTNITVDDEKWQRLKAIAAERRIPVSVLAREGIERVLDLAEKQQATIDRTLGELAEKQATIDG